MITQLLFDSSLASKELPPPSLKLDCYDLLLPPCCSSSIWCSSVSVICSGCHIKELDLTLSLYTQDASVQVSFSPDWLTGGNPRVLLMEETRRPLYFCFCVGWIMQNVLPQKNIIKSISSEKHSGAAPSLTRPIYSCRSKDLFKGQFMQEHIRAFFSSIQLLLAI